MFVKHILMGKGQGALEAAYYNYRVEFQMRGMAHIHGVVWLDPDKIKPYLVQDSEGFEYNDDMLPPLVDSLITCKSEYSDNSKTIEVFLSPGSLTGIAT